MTSSAPNTGSKAMTAGDTETADRYTVEPPGDLESAHRRLIVNRLPLFSLVWLVLQAIWINVLALQSHAAPAVAALLWGFQAAVLGAAIAICRRDSRARRVLPVTLAACVLIGVSSTMLFAALGGHAEVAAFVLLMLYLMTALMFAWSWQAEAALLCTTIPVLLSSVRVMGYVVTTIDFTAAVVIGSVIALITARFSERGVRVALLRREREHAAKRELEASRDAYRDLAENAPDLIYVHDRAGHFTYVNQAFARFAGEPAAALIGRSYRTVITAHPANPDFESIIAGLDASESVGPKLFEVNAGTGPRWVECRFSAERVADGRLVAVRGIARDVTERKRVEDALRASEKRYRGMVESQNDLISRSGLDYRLTFVNDAFCKQFGLRREDLLGRSHLSLVYEEDVATIVAAIGAVAAPPYRGAAEARAVTPDGLRWIAWEGSAIRDERGAVVEIQAVGRDVTERRAVEEAMRSLLKDLHDSEDRLRLLAKRQTQIREQERKRLGFDLHDDVCQELVGIGMLIEALRRRLPPISTETSAEFDRIGRYLNNIVEHLRLLARELRPMQLADLGLEGSLRALAKGMTSSSTEVRAEFAKPITRLEEETEVALFRVAQEALTNAIRHARARTIVLRLEMDDALVRLEVADDGCGFVPETASRAKAIGLVSMSERAKALGGHIEVRSETGKGTAVRLECPIVRAVQASRAYRRPA